MPAKKLTPVARLMQAMDACAVARGEVQWMNGYRAAKGGEYDATPEGQRLYQEQGEHWKVVEDSERAFRRIALRILKEVRRG